MSSADEKASVASASPSSIIRVPLIELENAVEQAFASGKTPLVVDTSDEDRVCTFYSYQSDVSLLEAKQIVLTGIRASPQEALEPFRRLLVNAMKFGKTLVVRLANSAPSLHSKWNDEALRIDNRDPASAFFPADVLYEGGQRLHGTVWPERLFREADMFPHKNVTYCLDGFRVLVTSQFSLDDLDEFLFESGALPPREHFQVVYIEPETH